MKEAREAQIQLRDKLKQRAEFEESEEESEPDQKPVEKKVKASDVLADLDLDNEWLEAKKEEEQVQAQLLEAVETSGTTSENKGGVLDLPTIVPTAKKTSEVEDSDGETEIEKELRETIAGSCLNSKAGLGLGVHLYVNLEASYFE